MSFKVELMISMKEMKALSREIIVKVRYLEKNQSLNVELKR